PGGRHARRAHTQADPLVGDHKAIGIPIVLLEPGGEQISAAIEGNHQQQDRDGGKLKQFGIHYLTSRLFAAEPSTQIRGMTEPQKRNEIAPLRSTYAHDKRYETRMLWKTQRAGVRPNANERPDSGPMKDQRGRALPLFRDSRERTAEVLMVAFVG